MHLRMIAYRCISCCIAPAKPGPKKPTKLTPADDALMLALIEQDPGITLNAIGERLSVQVAESTVCRRLQRLGLTQKKSMIARQQRRPDVVCKRKNFAIARRFVDPKKLVFLDESGAKTNMTRLYGRARVGERCNFFGAHGHWKTTTMISALRSDRIVQEATVLFDGPMNSVTFLGYIEQCLAPALEPGDVVVMDNLGAHKVSGVEEAIAPEPVCGGSRRTARI